MLLTGPIMDLFLYWNFLAITGFLFVFFHLYCTPARAVDLKPSELYIELLELTGLVRNEFPFPSAVNMLQYEFTDFEAYRCLLNTILEDVYSAPCFPTPAKQTQAALQTGYSRPGSLTNDMACMSEIHT